MVRNVDVDDDPLSDQRAKLRQELMQPIGQVHRLKARVCGLSEAQDRLCDALAAVHRADDLFRRLLRSG